MSILRFLESELSKPVIFLILMFLLGLHDMVKKLYCDYMDNIEIVI